MRRWAASLGALLLLVLMALLGWRAALTPEAVVFPAPSSSSASAPSSEAAVAPSSGLAALNSTAPAASAAAKAEPDGSEDLRAYWASREKVWDLCGVGRLPIPPAVVASGIESMIDLPKHLGEDPLNAARRALFAAMDNGSPRAQGVVMLWRVQQAHSASYQQAVAASAPPNASLPDDIRARSLQVVAKLAAAAEHDALLATWLLALCDNDAVCQAEAKARWLRADPDNGLARAQALEAKAPPASQVQARKNISQAQSFQSRFGSLSATVLANMPPEVPLYVQQVLLLEAVSMDGAFGLPLGLSSLMDLCRAPTGAVAHSECDAIARLMVERSDTLLTHRLGLSMGERLGWPKADVQERRARTQSTDLGPEMSWLFEPYSCASAKTMRTWVLELAEKGEMALLLERRRTAQASKQQSANASGAAASAATR